MKTGGHPDTEAHFQELKTLFYSSWHFQVQSIAPSRAKTILYITHYRSVTIRKDHPLLSLYRILQNSICLKYVYISPPCIYSWSKSKQIAKNTLCSFEVHKYRPCSKISKVCVFEMFKISRKKSKKGQGSLERDIW